MFLIAPPHRNPPFPRGQTPTASGTLFWPCCRRGSSWLRFALLIISKTEPEPARALRICLQMWAICASICNIRERDPHPSPDYTPPYSPLHPSPPTTPWLPRSIFTYYTRLFSHYLPLSIFSFALMSRNFLFSSLCTHIITAINCYNTPPTPVFTYNGSPSRATPSQLAPAQNN